MAVDKRALDADKNQSAINKRALGTAKEQMAADYLRGEGFTIVEMNFRCRFGEVDIISKDGDTLVFVEVKYRSRPSAGFPSEAVNLKKQKTISKVADFYRVRYGVDGATPCRFDVVSILGEEIRHIKNAFEYIGDW
ncbi:MAG: YraN family protein [Eubacterium sp.]|nr:YraN family protein [Eubacterium sp.]